MFTAEERKEYGFGTFEEDLKGSRTSRRPGELTMNEKNILLMTNSIFIISTALLLIC